MIRYFKKSNNDSIICGVCGGIAEYFELNPSLIRILFVLSLFLSGAGVIAYILLWIMMPD